MYVCVLGKIQSYKFGSLAFHSNVYHLCPQFNSPWDTRSGTPRSVPPGWAWDWHPILLESSQPLPPLVVKLLELGPPKGACSRGWLVVPKYGPFEFGVPCFQTPNGKWVNLRMRKWGNEEPLQVTGWYHPSIFVPCSKFPYIWLSLKIRQIPSHYPFMRIIRN